MGNDLVGARRHDRHVMSGSLLSGSQVPRTTLNWGWAFVALAVIVVGLAAVFYLGPTRPQQTHPATAEIGNSRLEIQFTNGAIDVDYSVAGALVATVVVVVPDRSTLDVRQLLCDEAFAAADHVVLVGFAQGASAVQVSGTELGTADVTVERDGSFIFVSPYPPNGRQDWTVRTDAGESVSGKVAVRGPRLDAGSHEPSIPCFVYPPNAGDQP